MPTSPAPDVASHRYEQDDLIMIDEIMNTHVVPSRSDPTALFALRLCRSPEVYGFSLSLVHRFRSIYKEPTPFSQKALSVTLPRVTRRAERGPLEWLLGQNLILMKSVSCFISPQKLFFARIQGGAPKQGWSVNEARLIPVRIESIHTLYDSTASSVSELNLSNYNLY